MHRAINILNRKTEIYAAVICSSPASIIRVILIVSFVSCLISVPCLTSICLVFSVVLMPQLAFCALGTGNVST